MTAPVIEVAEKLKDLINGEMHTISHESAERKYLPQLLLEEMGESIYITVMPVSEEVTILSRTKKQFMVEVDVGIQKKLNNDEGDDNVLDLRQELVNQIAFVNFKNIKAEYAGIKTPVLFNQDLLIEKRVMISVIRISYRVTE